MLKNFVSKSDFLSILRKTVIIKIVIIFSLSQFISDINE